MPYYNKCEYCDAALDPGERCDCDQSRRARASLLSPQKPMQPEPQKGKKKEAAA